MFCVITEKPVFSKPNLHYGMHILFNLYLPTLVLAILTIQVSFRPFKTVRQELLHRKDLVPANCKGVVYSIPCAHLHQPNRQVPGSSPSGTPLGPEEWRPCSLCSCRAWFSCDHQVNLSKATVIDTHPRTKTRCMQPGVPAQPTPAAPSQQRQGTLPGLLLLGMLHCWTDTATLGFYCANIITILTIILFSTFLPNPPFSLFTPFPFLYPFFLLLFSCISSLPVLVYLT